MSLALLSNVRESKAGGPPIPPPPPPSPPGVDAHHNGDTAPRDRAVQGTGNGRDGDHGRQRLPSASRKSLGREPDAANATVAGTTKDAGEASASPNGGPSEVQGHVIDTPAQPHPHRSDGSGAGVDEGGDAAAATAGSPCTSVADPTAPARAASLPRPVVPPAGPTTEDGDGEEAARAYARGSGSHGNDAALVESARSSPARVGGLASASASASAVPAVVLARAEVRTPDAHPQPTEPRGAAGRHTPHTPAPTAASLAEEAAILAPYQRLDSRGTPATRGSTRSASSHRPLTSGEVARRSQPPMAGMSASGPPAFTAPTSGGPHDALVAYAAQGRRSVAATTAAYGEAGHRSPSEAGSHGGVGSARQAELRGQLISAERAAAELREECARRGMTIDTMGAALDRERAALQAVRDRHAEELEDARREHEAQTRQLRDQLRVLKIVSEGAMADKAKTAEDAARRKEELLALLEREREEKSRIMADYRDQTESLIAEQGREITSLRAALGRVKEEYDRLAADHEHALNSRDDLAGQLEEARSQLDRERLEAVRRLKDAQERLSHENAALQEEVEGLRNDQVREAARAQARQQELADQLQYAQEKAAKVEEEQRNSAEALRQAYRRDVEALEKDLAAARAARERQEEDHRRELEKAARSEEKATDALRQALEEARRATEAAMADSFKQKEELKAQHRARANQLQAAAEAAGAELARERTARKELHAEAELLRSRVDALERSVEEQVRAREAAGAEQRARERSLESAHQEAVEELKSRLRGVTGELGQTQQQQRQQAQELQKAREELVTRAAALEQSRRALQTMEVELEREAAKQADAHAAREAELAHECEELRGVRKGLEAHAARLERGMRDAEARLQSVARQAEQERAALEETSARLSDARTSLEDMRHALDTERSRSSGLEAEVRALAKELQERKLHGEELENAARMQERRLQEASQDAQRQAKAHEGRLVEVAQRHKAELAAARMSAEQVRGELARAREALASKETALQALREEVSQLHRDAALREGALAEELDDAKEMHEAEMRRMDDILNGLRADLANTQQICTQYQRELASVHSSADGRYNELAFALEQSEAARVRLQEDARYREQLNQELQGTVRLLTSRLGAHEEELKRLHDELTDTGKRVQDAHTLIGRKDAAIGQLNAKLRAYESRGGVL